MSKVWYRFLSNLYVAPTTNPLSSRVYALRSRSGTVYGFDDHPYEYFYANIDGNYKWYYGELSASRDSNTEVDIGKANNVTIRYANLYFALDDGSQLDTFLKSKNINPVDTETISGKYKINKNNLATHIEYLNTSGFYVTTIPILCNFYLDDQQYRGMALKCNEGYYWHSDRIEFDKIELYHSDGTISSYTIPEFGSEFDGKTIEFAVATLPSVVYEWLTSFLDIIYPYIYTVRSNDGQTKLAEITEAPPMTNAFLTFEGNVKTLTLTGINDREYKLEWESTTPEGKILRGLSDGIASSSVLIPVNATTSVTFTESTVLYESYGTYRPANSFDVELYNCSAEVIRVDKTDYLTSYGTLSGTLREESSMIRPSITFQSSSVPRFNYVYISAFRRYYYVNNIVSVNKNLWRMELNCDVLMTYKDEIADVRLALARQEFNNNPYLVDSEFPLRVGNYYEIVTLESTAFDTTSSTEGHNYVLTVIGA